MGYEVVVDDIVGESYLIIPIGKYSENVFLGELAEEYHFDLNKAWLDWDSGYDGELTRLYINWRTK